MKKKKEGRREDGELGDRNGSRMEKGGEGRGGKGKRGKERARKGKEVGGKGKVGFIPVIIK